MFQGDSELTAYSEVGLGLGTPMSEDFGITVTLHKTKTCSETDSKVTACSEVGGGPTSESISLPE
jgi:hypothetical protein